MAEEHRWSGWPGAYCLDCHTGDPAEAALAHDCIDATCSYCGEGWPQGPCHSPDSPDHESHAVSWKDCGEHPSVPCVNNPANTATSALTFNDISETIRE